MSHDAWVKALIEPVSEKLASEQRDYEAAIQQKSCFADDDPIELNQHMTIVDGDTVIADTKKQGSFLKACKDFEKYVASRALEPKL